MVASGMLAVGGRQRQVGGRRPTVVDGRRVWAQAASDCGWPTTVVGW